MNTVNSDFFRVQLTELLQYIAVIDNRLASPSNILMKKQNKKNKKTLLRTKLGLAYIQTVHGEDVLEPSCLIPMWYSDDLPLLTVT